jgi:hypothetical protein
MAMSLADIYLGWRVNIIDSEDVELQASGDASLSAK